MPLTEKGRKIMRSMRKTYGDSERAKRVFYASANAGRIKGVEGRGSRRKSRRGR
jgi:hypothetical protein